MHRENLYLKKERKITGLLFPTCTQTGFLFGLPEAGSLAQQCHLQQPLFPSGLCFSRVSTNFS